MPREDKFIDIDEEKERAGLETESYEQIVLRQIQRCADVLSKERTGGQVTTQMIKGKRKLIVLPDTREESINHVKILRFLLTPFIKNRLKDEFKKIDEEKEKEKEEMDEQLIKVNKETKKAKEFKFIPPNHPILRVRAEKECDLAEKLFGVLVKAFHLSRTELKELERE